MGKKILVILLFVSILVYIVSTIVPGSSLEDGSQLTFDSLKLVIESVSGNSDTFMFDLALIRTLQLYLVNFDFNAEQKIIFTWGLPNPGEYIYTGIIIQSTPEGSEDVETIRVLSGLHLSSDTHSGLVSVLGWLNHEPCNGNVLKTVFLVVKTFVGFLVAILFILVYLIFDILTLLWSVLLGMLRLFGWVT